MTDSIREQIKRDAAKWFGDDFKRGNRSAIDIFKEGATHQHPIAYSQGLAEGRRQAVEDCIETLKALPNPFRSHIQELEKLKSDICASKAKCPKCKSRNLVLIEEWKGHTIQWIQEDGRFDRNDGTLEPGSPFRVEAKCHDCNHAWTFKGATQIDDLMQLT